MRVRAKVWLNVLIHYYFNCFWFSFLFNIDEILWDPHKIFQTLTNIFTWVNSFNSTFTRSAPKNFVFLINVLKICCCSITMGPTSSIRLMTLNPKIYYLCSINFHLVYWVYLFYCFPTLIALQSKPVTRKNYRLNCYHKVLIFHW